MKTFILSAFLFIISFSLYAVSPISTTASSVIYVDIDATGAYTGKSWEDAFTSLQSALDEAEFLGECEIWVAKGHYLPSQSITGSATGSSINKTFVIDFGVELYGGFAGHESSKNERIEHLYKTVLSGDHLSNDRYIMSESNSEFPASSNEENSTNIMNIHTSETVIIDGFSFKGGNANHPILFNQRNGGAIYIEGNSNCEIRQCIFEYNVAELGGGAIYNTTTSSNSDLVISRCIFQYNSSQTRDGAALYNRASGGATAILSIGSSLFYKNVAANRGGALYSFSVGDGRSLPYIESCTFVDNQVGIDGGALFAFLNMPDGGVPSEINILSSIFYNNEANNNSNSFAASNVVYDPIYSNFPEAASYGVPSNSSVDPMLLSSFNFRLKKESPLIDQGFGAAVTADKDLDGNTRVMGGKIDIGAYEYLSCPSDNIIYVNDNSASTLNSGDSPSHPIKSLSMALAMACDCKSSAEIRVAEGIYIPERRYQLVPALVLNKYYLQSKVNLLGSYSEDFSSRDPIAKLSIISGDIDRNDTELPATRDDNVFGLMYVSGSASGSFIRGFEFRGGDMKISEFHDSAGSGIEIAPSATADFQLEIKQCKFQQNRSVSEKGTVYTHGGSTGRIVSIKVDSCEFISNSSSGASSINFHNALGIGLLEINHSTFETNTSQSVNGAITYKALGLSGTSDVKITDCSFEENMTAGKGASVSIVLLGNERTSVNISDSEFIDNHAGDVGGAVYIATKNECEHVLKNSLFQFNTADNGGGAYAFTNEYQGGTNMPEMINCIFKDNAVTSNTPNSGGAVLYTAISTILNVWVKNSTFTNNEANYGAAAIASNGIGVLDIQNSVFWINLVNGVEKSVIAISGDSQTYIDYDHCSIGEVDCNLNNTNCRSGMIYATDPSLDASGTPFSGSPIINRGKYELLPSELFDHTGSRPRVLNHEIDMGAMEYEFPCQNHLVLTPGNLLYGNVLRGAWRARQSITVMPGLGTNVLDWLVLDAPEVIIESDYIFSSNTLLEIRQDGCN